MTMTMTMRSGVGMAVALAALCGPPAMAQPPGGGGGPFDSFDRNKDGKLSRDELPPPMRDRFATIDTNRDGVISREEDRAFFSQRRPGGGGGTVRVPETVRVEKDIAYAGTSNPRQTLDLYLPKSREDGKKLPVIVNIHGGAFLSGDKTQGAQALVPFVASGAYAAASINYRLSGEAIWPAQAHDCKAAIRWVRANAAKYGLDPDRIGVIGGSAGGHLVAMLGTSGQVKDLEGTLGEAPGASSAVQCVVDQFGPSELLTMGDAPSQMDHNAPGSPESKLLGGPVQEKKEEARSASPITYVTKDDPPFLIIHGDADPLVPFNQSERLAKALTDAGVECLFVRVAGGGHGGFGNPEVPRRIRLFFDKHLRDVDTGPISTETIPNGAAAGPDR
jgi:acetyl esterase/lipase